MSLWKCRSCQNLNFDSVARCSCGFVNDALARKAVVAEGRNAYRNDVASSDNPYADSDTFAALWSQGWSEAEMLRSEFHNHLPHLLKRQQEKEIRDLKVQKVGDLIDQAADRVSEVLFIKQIFTFLHKLIINSLKIVIAVLATCLGVYLIYMVGVSVFSWPLWAIIIVVLLFLILLK